MKKLTLKKLMIYELLFIFLVGSLMHFIYDWSPNPITALISPVNESIWEHLKMFILPMILVGCFEYRFIKKAGLVLWAKLAQLAFMMIFIIAFFYTYTGVFGIKSILAIDIMSFFLAIYLGQKISYYILATHKKPPIKTPFIIAILVLIFAGFISFTYCAPSIPLFQSPEKIISLDIIQLID